MEGFDHILNWTLQRGSHQFPGKSGGTCINEAALVTAGFPYRPVWSVHVMPRCFSRPICRLAMHLNDEATDSERQRLLPFVTRLACADTRGFPTTGDVAFPGNQNMNDSIKTFISEGGTVLCCRFGLALHGLREEDVIEGVVPCHPLDVQDAVIHFANKGAIINSVYNL